MFHAAPAFVYHNMNYIPFNRISHTNTCNNLRIIIMYNELIILSSQSDILQHTSILC